MEKGIETKEINAINIASNITFFDLSALSLLLFFRIMSVALIKTISEILTIMRYNKFA